MRTRIESLSRQDIIASLKWNRTIFYWFYLKNPWDFTSCGNIAAGLTIPRERNILFIRVVGYAMLSQRGGKVSGLRMLVINMKHYIQSIQINIARLPISTAFGEVLDFQPSNPGLIATLSQGRFLKVSNIGSYPFKQTWNIDIQRDGWNYS